MHNFVELGVPMRFRSDNGPQFDAGVFQETLQRWGVAWRNSTPHYPQSNGHAEAVKEVEELVAKTALDGLETYRWKISWRGYWNSEIPLTSVAHRRPKLCLVTNSARWFQLTGHHTLPNGRMPC